MPPLPQHAPDGTPRRNCGDCTLCCTLMGVAEVPVAAPGGPVADKPPTVRCHHVCSRGCRIYRRLDPRGAIPAEEPR